MTDIETALKEQIRNYILENLAVSKGMTSLVDGESLVENGVIDSLGIFQLVAFLEETFRIPIGDEEITHENFLTIEAIERFVVAKLRHGG